MLRVLDGMIVLLAAGSSSSFFHAESAAVWSDTNKEQTQKSTGASLEKNLEDSLTAYMSQKAKKLEDSLTDYTSQKAKKLEDSLIGYISQKAKKLEDSLTGYISQKAESEASPKPSKPAPNQETFTASATQSCLSGDPGDPHVGSCKGLDLEEDLKDDSLGSSKKKDLESSAKMIDILKGFFSLVATACTALAALAGIPTKICPRKRPVRFVEISRVERGDSSDEDIDPDERRALGEHGYKTFCRRYYEGQTYKYWSATYARAIDAELLNIKSRDMDEDGECHRPFKVRIRLHYPTGPQEKTLETEQFQSYIT